MINLKKYFQKRKRGKLMVVFPHPDDEAFATAGLLLFAKKAGWETVVVLMTKGGAGKLYTNPNGKPLEKIREEEARRSARILRVDKLIFGNFPDGKLKNQKAKWSRWLTGIISEEKPNTIVTYDHSGITGHPDHISLSLEVKRLVCANNKRIDLYWSTVPKSFKEQIVNSKVFNYSVRPTHKLYLNIDIFRKAFSIHVHKSQHTVPFSKLLFLLFMVRVEWYHKVDLTRNYSYKYVDFKI
jgi:LmbE family N-acetylglucosaminyl deacetylase